ncbi:MAG: hypothetical protein HBSAPP04_16680 [Ignavibacteriaceae bacterium]|nr:MAG: PEGA domain-containing protein [Chlorobiota bacterium]GJQ32829.1 MAG: hypothetical protein HBSAPP04_16680 [Ignavibacteriaceae bacterium]
MRNSALTLLAVLAFIFAGCETSPPVNVENDIFGGLVVSGSPQGAAIFVDGVNTGKTLPDTVTVKAGIRSVRIEKDGFISETRSVTVPGYAITEEVFNLAPVTEQKLVVLEDFANVSCVPCVTSNRIIQSLKSGTYTPSQLLVIKYHMNYPSPQDPFYQANKTQINARGQLYYVLSTPTTYIDGQLKPVSSDSSQIKGYINQQLAKPAQFRMNVSDSVAGGVIYAKVRINVLSMPQVDTNDIILNVYALQTETSFATPPGSNGETVFYDVVRGFFAGSGGIIPTIKQSGQELSFDFAMATGNGWDLSKIKVVAFLQHKTTREIYQAAYSLN